jgi:Tol biopolymer transport system component
VAQPLTYSYNYDPTLSPDGNTEGRATAPKWSPDGRTIYFSNCWKTGLKSACEIFAAAAPGS